MDINDVRLTKQARNLFGKHDLDITMADIRVSYGVCRINGMLQKLPKTNVENVEARTNKVAEFIQKLPGIKQVVVNCSFKEDYF